MTNYVNMDILRFQLHHVHALKNLLQLDRFADYDPASIDLILDAVKDFSDKELYPIFQEMDEQPAYYKDGKIVVHPAFEHIIPKAAEMGLIGGVFDYEEGGVQLPNIVGSAAYFIMEAANNAVPGYMGLTAGAAELILAFGKQELKDTFVPNMLAGKWGGTMCLTEPQAGSSLSDISTKAYPQPDGSYKIKGQKIFISAGDHEYCDNFVHLLLARIDGAPAGTKGISLFVVPKKRIEQGALVNNDVTTVGDFQKLGQRAYCTTHLAFGDQDNCTGYLVGQEHRGLKYMFLMMNNARIGVGRGAVSIASAAYHASLQYAKERPQGRRLNNDGKKNVDQEQSLIIEHADVRRMLLTQKTIYEGALSLVLQSSYYQDQLYAAQGEEAEKYQLLLELLTPVTKTYPSEKGREAVDNGLQILGGYGFCTEFILQQYYRDIRIFALYEGTTGIQSLDLLGRKVVMQNGRALQYLVEEMQTSIQAAMAYEALKKYATQLGQSMQSMQKVLTHLMPKALAGKHEAFLADATIFMEFFGTIVIAWQWLKIATASQEQATKDSTYSAEFHKNTLKSMQFFYTYELAKTEGLVGVLSNEEELTLLKGDEWIF